MNRVASTRVGCASSAGSRTPRSPCPGLARRILPAVSLVILSMFAGPSCMADVSYSARRSDDGLFVIRCPAHLERMAEEVEKLLVESAGEIAHDLGLESIDRMEVIIAPGPREYEKMHKGGIPEWGAAFSDGYSQLMGLNAEAVLRQPRPLRFVVRHELSHLLFYQRVGGVRCPTWLLEGVAMLQSHEWGFTDQWSLMRYVWTERVPFLEDLEERFPSRGGEAELAYRISYAAVEELLRERKEDLITLTAFTREMGSFDEAFLATFGESAGDFSIRFGILMRRRYRSFGVLLQSPPYWLILALLFVCLYIVKRIRNYRRLREWERTEGGGTARGAFN